MNKALFPQNRRKQHKMFIFVRVNLLMLSLVIFNLTILAHQHKQGEHQEEQEVNCSLIQLFLFQTGRVGEMTYGTVQTCHLVLFVLLLIRYLLRTKNLSFNFSFIKKY